MERKKILLIDGHGLAFRAFYALPELNAPDGTPTNAVLGFANMILKVRQDIAPEEVAVCFDSPTPSFRKNLFPEYKEGRRPTPEAFKPQIPLIKEFMALMGFPVLEQEGVEADDLIATAAQKALSSGLEVTILTADKDFLQLLQPGISIIKPEKGISQYTLLDATTFREKFGFEPEHFTTWLCLTGDSVDNIPGIQGIGEKTATSIVQKFPSLDELFRHLDKLPSKMAEKIRSSEERLWMNLELVVLKKDLPFDLGLLAPGKQENAQLTEWADKLGLRQLSRRLGLPQTPAVQVCLEPQGVLDLVPETAKAVPSPLGSVITNPPFALSFDVIHLPAGRAALQEACLINNAGQHASFGPAYPLTVEILKNILAAGRLSVFGLKEFFSALDWAPEDFSHLFDNQTARYLLHPEKPFSFHQIHEGPLTERASRILGETPSLARELDRFNLGELAKNIDLPLSFVLARMERAGIGADAAGFQQLSSDLSRRITEISTRIHEQIGKELNLNSPQQVGHLLFETLGLPVLKRKKNGPSTDASVLETLALDPRSGEVPRLLLEHREVSKLLTGFVEPFQKQIEPSTGAIHSTFDTLSTATGRLTSRDPNLQNLPQFGDWAGRFRKCLVPRKKTHVFIAADYSQIELRVLAHLCGDAKLKGAFEAGRDIHTETASWVFNVLPALVTPDLRRAAKAVNFGLLYGMSGHGLGQRLGVSRTEAQSMIERYFSALPEVRDYLEEMVAESRKRGYTLSYFGRIRPLSEVSTVEGRGNDAIRRVALNTPIQSTAADIAKMAMIAYSRTSQGKNGDAPLVLQVHDSLVCECPANELEQAGTVLKKTMENAVRLSVPLTVELKQGFSFASI